MKTVTYLTDAPLSCACGSDIILCIADTVVTVTGAPYIDATLDSVTMRYYVDACGQQQVTYYNTISYGTENLPDADPPEVQQLVDPDYYLVQADMLGVICDDCLLSYINWLVSPR